MKKWLGAVTICGAALTVVAVTTQPANAADKKKQEINITVSQEMPSADTSLATDTISFAAINNFDEGLYRVNADQEVEAAGAAKLATVSEDGLTYTVDLRKTAKWSNGDAVTAKDYVYAWQRTVDPKTASEYAYLFASVKNGEEIAAGKKDKSELGIEAVDDYTLKITLAKATPYFKYLMAFPSFFPQNQKVVEANGSKYASSSATAVYNGPFTLEDFDGPGSDTEWTYQKSDTYWDKDNVKLNKINVSVVKESSTALNLFKDGEADDVILSGELAQQNANNKAYQSIKESRTTYIEMNQRKKSSVWNNANLRKAISYSINRKALVTSILGDGSVASTGLVPAGMAANPKTDEDFAKEAGNDVSYSKKKAAAAWKKAKKELGIKKLSFKLLSDDTDSIKKVAQYLQSTIEEALPGVKVTIENVPFSVRLDRSNNGKFDMVLGGWAADYADPSSFTDLFVTGNSYNRGRWSSTAYDKAVKASSTTNAGNETKRWTNMLDAENIIMKDMGVIPVFQKAEGHLISTNVKGIVSHGTGAKWDYKWAYVK